MNNYNYLLEIDRAIKQDSQIELLLTQKLATTNVSIFRHLTFVKIGQWLILLLVNAVTVGFLTFALTLC